MARFKIREPTTAETDALKAELRQIGVDHRAGVDARHAAFREEWNAKMAAEPARPPIHRSELRPTAEAR